MVFRFAPVIAAASRTVTRLCAPTISRIFSDRGAIGAISFSCVTFRESRSRFKNNINYYKLIENVPQVPGFT